MKKSFLVFVVFVCFFFGVVNVKMIVDIVVGDDCFSMLVVVVQVVGLQDVLQGLGLFMVFVFVNDVFVVLLVGIVEILLKLENKDQLINVLFYYVDDCELIFNKILVGFNYFKLFLISECICIIKFGGGVEVVDGIGVSVNVIIVDIQVDNGVIYVIDKVLILGECLVCY